MWRYSPLFVVVACACGTPSSDPQPPSQPTPPSAACTAIDASACVDPVPSYESDIAPLLDRACNSTCHAPGVGPWPLTDYSDVYAWSSAIAFDVSDCAMPPLDAGAGNGPLSDAERATLLDWIACGAPDN